MNEELKSIIDDADFRALISKDIELQFNRFSREKIEPFIKACSSINALGDNPEEGYTITMTEPRRPE